MESRPTTDPETSLANAVVSPAKQRLRVAHCIHSLQIGGAERTIEYLVRFTRDERLERYYVFAAHDGPLRRVLQESGAEVIVVPRAWRWFDPFWLARLALAFRRHRIDVVHTHLFGDTLHGLLAARLARRPAVVVTLHSTAEMPTRFHAVAYRRLMAMADLCVGSCPSVLTAFRQLGSELFRVGMVIPNGIAVDAPTDPDDPTLREAREGLGVGPQDFLIGAVGRLVPHKGFDSLLQAFALMPQELRESSRLVIVGDGPLRSQLENACRQLEISDRVKLTGIRRDVARLLRCFDVFVSSSVLEGFPLAVLEAMAAQRCIVATDVAGNLDALRPDLDAVIARRGDPKAIADALARVAGDAGLRSRLSSSALLRFRSEFTATRMAEDYFSVYRELASGR